MRSPEHVPPRDAPFSERWDTKGKPQTVQKRNPVQLGKDTVHKAIHEHGIRKRYGEFKTTVLQVLTAPKQKPPKSSPFALCGPDAYWVQTTMVHESGNIPFSELPGMHPRADTLEKLWQIPKKPTGKGEEGYQLKGIALGVAQYVVGLLELRHRRRPGTMKVILDNEPSWLNMEAFKAARVLIKEVSAFYH